MNESEVQGRSWGWRNTWELFEYRWIIASRIGIEGSLDAGPVAVAILEKVIIYKCKSILCPTWQVYLRSLFIYFPGIVFEIALPSQKPESTYPNPSESALT